MIRCCIILGAMKAGTTSLFNYLAQHPEIAACPEKEPSFFSHHYNDSIDAYLKLWKDQDIANKILMEASVNYTKHPSFPQTSANILDFSQKNDVDFKFIYIMRNPFDRIESQYTYSYALWTTDSLQKRIEHGHLVNVSRYGHQLDQYYDDFDDSQFLLLDFDDFIKKPPKTLKRICRFLNIETDFQFESTHKVYNKSQGKIITRPIERLYKKHPLLKTCARLVPKNFKQRLAGLLFRKRVPHNFKLSPEQKKLIYDNLKEDMAHLRQKYGIDVSKWEF